MREKYYPEEPDTSETSVAEWKRINMPKDDLTYIDIPMVTSEQSLNIAIEKLRMNRYDPDAPDDDLCGSYTEGEVFNSRISWNRQFEAMNRVIDSSSPYERDYLNKLEWYYLP